MTAEPTSVSGIVDAAAGGTPDALAATFPDAQLTYSQLAESSRLWARRLHAAGVRSGPETRQDVPDGTPGELLCRGPCRLLEYFRDPEATAAAIDPDGWFHSGDLLRRERDGDLVFLSRLKDMLKVGGENVAAAEIEGFLLQHTAVHIAQVVAAPDGRYGEVPAAFVQLAPGTAPTERELIDFCIGRIATLKVPRYVRFIDEWPMSGTKIKKVALRETIAQEIRQAGIEQAPRVRA